MSFPSQVPPRKDFGRNSGLPIVRAINFAAESRSWPYALGVVAIAATRQAAVSRCFARATRLAARDVHPL
ncbi:MAG: hypothetical protein DMG42_24785 [Acidobacteria bacterium]|nr:MAG: hypothetical protein DMG42_24785 [Acidobacteriota bacterium]